MSEAGPQTFAIVPIVEGHGEQIGAARILLDRLVLHLGEGRIAPRVLRPIRQPRPKLVDPVQLERSVRLAAARLEQFAPDAARRLILLLCDSDDDLVCRLAPRVSEAGRRHAGGADFEVVFPVLEWETWFAASAESLTDYLELGDDDPPKDPEAARCRKAWIEKRWARRGKYSETVDQPALTQSIDLDLCRRRSRSFDKLCREIERRLIGVGDGR